MGEKKRRRKNVRAPRKSRQSQPRFLKMQHFGVDILSQESERPRELFKPPTKPRRHPMRPIVPVSKFLPMQPAAKNRRGAAARGHPAFSEEDGDRDSELEQALLGLGIEPLLAQGPSGNKQARDRGGWGRRGVSRESSGSVVSVPASGGKGSKDRGRGAVEAEDAVAAEATKNVKRMLHIART